MLQHELEEGMGRKVSDAEYLEANEVYMAAGEINKQQFYAAWKVAEAHKEVKFLIGFLADEVKRLEKKCTSLESNNRDLEAKLEAKIEKLEQKSSDYVCALQKCNEMADEIDILTQAIHIISKQ